MRQELAEWKLAVDKDKGGKTKANAKVISERKSTKRLEGLVTVYNDYPELSTNDFHHRKRKDLRVGRRRKRRRI